jgi:hypothetical protein
MFHLYLPGSLSVWPNRILTTLTPEDGGSLLLRNVVLN